jgi:hypothetical protein
MSFGETTIQVSLGESVANGFNLTRLRAKTKGVDGIEDYWRQKNQTSLDGFCHWLVQ